MDKIELKHFEELLNKEKERRTSSLEDDRLGVGMSLRDTTSELSSYDNHPGDLGNETFEAERNYSFRTREKFFLGEVEAALNKIAEGNYGQCEVCHKEIERDRLEVRPYTRLCIHCENDMEQKVDDEEKGRPIEEQVIYPSMGYMFRDNTINDEVGFDGEDTWDAVNEYNVVMSDNQYGEEDEAIGYVEDVEQISNEQYKRQLE
jgi:YteA family regulatory protein